MVQQSWQMQEMKKKKSHFQVKMYPVVKLYGLMKQKAARQRRLRNFVRFFLSGATECEIDKQGRFLIPANLRISAKLEKDAMIIGVGTRLEIWDKATWQKCDENISADEIAENMTMLGI